MLEFMVKWRKKGKWKERKLKKKRGEEAEYRSVKNIKEKRYVRLRYKENPRKVLRI